MEQKEYEIGDVVMTHHGLAIIMSLPFRRKNDDTVYIMKHLYGIYKGAVRKWFKEAITSRAALTELDKIIYGID